MYSYGPPHMAEQKQLEHKYSRYMRIRDVALETCQRWWLIGRSGKRGSGISVLAARHDDNDNHKTKKELLYGGDSDTSYSWCTWNSQQRLKKDYRGTRNQGKNWDCPASAVLTPARIVRRVLETWRLRITQIPVIDLLLEVVGKTCLE